MYIGCVTRNYPHRSIAAASIEEPVQLRRQRCVLVLDRLNILSISVFVSFLLQQCFKAVEILARKLPSRLLQPNRQPC